MRARSFLLLPFLFLALAGCDQTTLMGKFASEEEQTLARSYIERLRLREFDVIERSVDKGRAGPDLRGTLEKMAALVPAGEIRSVKMVGAHKHFQDGVTSLNTTFEYEFPGAWMLANVVVEERGGRKIIAGFNVYPRSQSLEAENRFGLVGKQPIQYLVLAGAAGALLISVYALIVCARTAPLRRKGLWILFILAGVGKFAVNWTSGEWRVFPLSAQLPSASATAPLYGPWIVSFSIPVGAIVFLFYARRRGRGSVDS
jgi:hypothetical protein